MRRVILSAIIFVIWIWATPNFSKFAQIIGKNGGISYIDSEGKLWILDIKWKTEKIEQREGPFYIIRNGKIDTIPARTGMSWDHQLYPYLYFWLYDKDGKKINEGNLGDSIGAVIFNSLVDGGALLIVGACHDYPWGHNCYSYFILLDKNGAIKQKKMKPTSELLSHIPIDEYVVNAEGKVFLTFINKPGIFMEVYVEDEEIKIVENPEVVPYPTLRYETHMCEMLSHNIPFAWTKVDTVFWAEEHGRKEIKSRVVSKDKIQILHFDALSQKWTVERYQLSTASARKFVGFELFTLQSLPTIKDQPEVQSVRLNNANIVLTVLMKENDKPVAYQMFFDSLGNYITPVETKVMKPWDIEQIPENSKIYIRREPAGYTESGRDKGAKVYIWGYSKEDGMLYWKMYRFD